MAYMEIEYAWKDTGDQPQRRKNILYRRLVLRRCNRRMIKMALLEAL
jgi:hypothetical protein